MRVRPVLTRAEMYKAGVHHIFSANLARQNLLWELRVSTLEGMTRVLRHYHAMEKEDREWLASSAYLRSSKRVQWILHALLLFFS